MTGWAHSRRPGCSRRRRSLQGILGNTHTHTRVFSSSVCSPTLLLAAGGQTPPTVLAGGAVEAGGAAAGATDGITGGAVEAGALVGAVWAVATLWTG